MGVLLGYRITPKSNDVFFCSTFHQMFELLTDKWDWKTSIFFPNEAGSLGHIKLGLACKICHCEFDMRCSRTVEPMSAV